MQLGGGRMKRATGAALESPAAPDAGDAFIAAARSLLRLPELIAVPPPDGEIMSPIGVFISEADDRCLRVIRRAERCRREGKWADALAAYQVLLDERVQSDFPATEGIYIPVDEYCRRRMLTLPAEAVRAYRTLYDTEARKLYEKALAARSPELLADVARLYPISSVALPAMKESADVMLEMGRFDAALRAYSAIFARLRPESRAGFSPSMALLKAAVCLKAIGNKRAADDAADFLESPVGRQEGDNLALHIAAVRSMAAGKPAAPDWGAFGGDSSHSRTPEKATLPGRLRWNEHKPEEDREVQSRDVAQPGFRPARDTMCQPAASDGVVYYRTETTIIARDIATGKDVWRYREQLVDRNGNPIPRTGYYTRNRGGTLFISARNGTAYANVFFISYEGNFRQDTRFKLLAIRDGAKLWERGGQNEKDENLRDLSFTSAPVVSGNRLYVGAMEASSEEMHLCAFDAETGKLLWKTFICAGRFPVRYDYRCANGVGEMPAEQDGIVYFAPSFGMASAVEAATGRVLWKSIFEQPAERRAMEMFYINYFRPNNPPILHNGRMFILPADSENLYALEMETGSVLWKHNVGKDFYLLGVKDDRVVISGTRVAAIAADGSRMIFSTPLSAEPQGRGLLAETFAICPTEDGIELVHLETGRLVGVKRPNVSWREWLAYQEGLRAAVQSGNLLIAADAALAGKLIIAGENSLQVFDELVNPDEVLAQLQKSPNDPVLHTKLAWHYLREGKLFEAAAQYEVALKLAQSDASHSKLVESIPGELFTIYLELGDAQMAAGEFAKSTESFGKAFDRAPGKSEKLHALVKVAESRLASGKVAAAVDVLQEIVANYGDTLFSPDGYLTVQGMTYAEARLGEVLRQHGQEHYSKYDDAAAAILDARPGNADAARSVLAKYPHSRLAPSCLMIIAKAAMDAEDYRAATQHLALLARRFGKATETAEAQNLLAVCLEKQKITVKELYALKSIYPPLEQKWTTKTEAGTNFAWMVDAPAAADGVADLFYMILGKNVYCRRAQDGSLVWQNSAGWLGVSLAPPINAQTRGTEIMEVMAGTPAEAAGLLRNDVIVEFDGTPVQDTTELIRICGNTPAGSAIKMKVLRKGKETALTVTLGERSAKYDQMERGIRIFYQGMAAAAKSKRQAMVFSRDRFVQCIDPATGKVVRKFPVDPVRTNAYSQQEPTRNDGIALADEQRMVTITPGAVEMRIQVMPQQPQMNPQAPQLVRSQPEIAAWDMTTGQQVWRQSLGRRPVTDPFIYDDMAVVVEADNEWQVFITAYSLATGEQAKSIGPIRTNGKMPLGIFEISGGRICIPIGQEILCYQLDGPGRQIWSRHVGTGEVNVFRVIPPSKEQVQELILAGTEGSGIQIIDAETGRELWSLSARDSHNSVDCLGFDDDQVYICSKNGRDGCLRAFSTTTGKQVWETTLKDMPFAADLLIADAHVVLAMNQLDPLKPTQGAAKVAVLDKATGNSVQEILLKDKTVYSLKLVNGVLLVITNESVIGFAPKGPKA